MKLNYYPETDSLYIDFAERSSTESKEVSEGVGVDSNDSHIECYSQKKDIGYTNYD